MALVTAVAGPVAAQEGEAEVPEGAPPTRVVTIGVIEATDNCLGGPGPCWDTPTAVYRAGESYSLVADLRSSANFHNLEITTEGLEVTYEPAAASGDTTQAAGNAMHWANFTIPADFNGEIEYVCAVHPTTMIGSLVTPEVFIASGGGGEPIHHLGVHFLAYWVGLIAFALLFIVYGITFFLFKYNETTATTDQWDRTGAGAPEAKNTMTSGNATLLAIVLAGVALAAIVYVARMG